MLLLHQAGESDWDRLQEVITKHIREETSHNLEGEETAIETQKWG